MKDIILKNSEWMRGLGRGWLLHHNDEDNTSKMCCVGVVSKDLGAKDEDLAEHVSLLSTCGLLSFGNSVGLGWMFNTNSEDSYNYNDSEEARKIFGINDDKIGKDTERVAALNKIFNKHDINLVYREDL